MVDPYFFSFNYLCIYFKGKMQISSDSSSHSSTNEIDSNNALSTLISTSITEERKETTKVSFSVLKQRTTSCFSQNKLLGKRDYNENEDEDGDQSTKRKILHLEDGVPVEYVVFF